MKEFEEGKRYYFDYGVFQRDMRREADTEWAKEIHGKEVCVVHGYRGKLGGYNIFADWCVEFSPQLVAAAPEMLEALKLLLDAYEEAHALHDLGECEGTIKARAAIAKAEGRGGE